MPFQKRQKDDLENIYEKENEKVDEKPQEPLVPEVSTIDITATNYSKLPLIIQKIYRGNPSAAKLVGKIAQPPVDRTDATLKSNLLVLCEVYNVLCEIRDALKK